MGKLWSILYSFFRVFFFFKQKTAYEMQRGLVGSEMCIRDRYQRRVHGIYEFFDRQKSWENDEMFARRLMNYDVSIIHVIKVYPDRVGSSKIVRRFVTKNYANTYFYYIVELLSSFDLCELKRIGRKKICNFEPLFSNQVYINSEEYYSFIEHNHKSTHKLKMEVSAKSKYIQNISREILAGIDFTTKPKLEPEPIESTLPSVLEDFHFTFSHLDYCLLYTSDAADDTPCVDLGGRRIIKKKKKHKKLK
eukprot:TRINITY_DN2169_c0_g1_i2.p1 TRINITY_DN2169_c0_g1~~TRINITY_DN2169_c0_g1_i2.p1  ORF type:complete len:249 (-),score=63.05 TRINITY_DN2169_c0_g1_i2:52-798(-)